MPITKSIKIPKVGCFVDFHIGENAMDNFNVIDERIVAIYGFMWMGILHVM